MYACTHIYMYIHINIHTHLCIYVYTYIYVFIHIYIYTYTCTYTCTYIYIHVHLCSTTAAAVLQQVYTMGWLRLVGSFKLQVSFAECRLLYRSLLQKRPRAIMLRSDSCHMGWLRLVGSFKLQLSFAEYRLLYRSLLQKRPRAIMLLSDSLHTIVYIRCTRHLRRSFRCWQTKSTWRLTFSGRISAIGTRCLLNVCHVHVQNI